MRLSVLALSLIASGYSVIPIQEAGKKPSISAWLPYQSAPMDTMTAEREFKEGRQIAVITGSISGNLELIDFDTDANGKCPHFNQWWQMLKENGYEDFLRTLSVAKTPSGGYHVFYRCPEGIGNNQPLAKVTVNTPPIIETRGEGGYALIYPSPGYIWRQGNLESVPKISAEYRDILIHASTMFDERPQKEAPVRKSKNQFGDDEPWTVYNARTDMIQLLESEGWKHIGKIGNREKVRRPGKDNGELSGTVTTIGDQVFYPFTTSTIFPDRKGLDCFGVYAWLRHNGDFSEATKSVRNSLGMTAKKPSSTIQTAKSTTELEGLFERKKLSSFDAHKMPEFGICGKYLIKGHFNLLDGQGGMGKSTLLMALASFGSKGYNPITGEECKPFRTLYFSTEDEGSTLRRTFEFFKGDADYLELVDKPIDIYGEDTLTYLSKLIVREEFAMWILDPAITYMPAHFQAIIPKHVNDFINGIKQVARETNTCPVGVRHFAKGAKLEDYENMGSGSTGWRDYARSQLVLVKHPDNHNQRIVIHGKPSMGVPKQPSFGFEWSGSNFSWIMPGEVDGDLKDK